MPLEVGQSLSHYRIVRKIGEGGMGEVYLAQDTKLDRQVALKVLPAKMADDPERLERFKREAKAVAALNHPNIVTIHSIEESDGVRFLTMELVEGESLDRIVPREGLPLGRLFEIAIPLADALAVAHERGIVHRDLKPANVMMTRDDRVKVLDFGLAKLAAASVEEDEDAERTQAATRTALTSDGTVMGTAPYMSPEQIEGRVIGPTADIFSLGVVLYEMATGRRPFQGDSSPALVSSILRDTPTPASEVNEALPRHLGRIIQHCLEKEPRDRYQSALDVRNELRSLRREIESGALETGGVRRSTGAARRATGRGRRPGLWGAAGVVLVLILVAVWWLGRGGGERASVAPESRPAPATAAEDGPSVAVLPFANLSADPDNEYFTDGLTEELIQALSRVEGLRIPARSSVFALKATNLSVQEVGKRLGVDTVLEGSVRKSGSQLRISAQLIKVADGFNLWSETYDRQLEDVFAIQDEIADHIVTALQLTLSPGDGHAEGSERTTAIQAYDYYLRGRGYFRRRTRDDFEAARRMFSGALDIDPQYAPAWAGIADTYTELWRNYESTEENLQRAEEASRRAVELDPELAAAHAALGYALGQRQRYDEAAREFRRAIELDPKGFEGYFYYGTVAIAQGDHETAARMLEGAHGVAPADERALRLLPMVYRSLDRSADERDAYMRRLALAEKRLEIAPDDVQTLLDGSLSLAALGERERSLEWAERLLDLDTDDALILYNLACFYSLAGETDKALGALERSYEGGMVDPGWMRQDTDLNNIRDHPRFKALLERMESGS